MGGGDGGVATRVPRTSTVESTMNAAVPSANSTTLLRVPSSMSMTCAARCARGRCHPPFFCFDGRQRVLRKSDAGCIASPAGRHP